MCPTYIFERMREKIMGGEEGRCVRWNKKNGWFVQLLWAIELWLSVLNPGQRDVSIQGCTHTHTHRKNHTSIYIILTMKIADSNWPTLVLHKDWFQNTKYHLSKTCLSSLLLHNKSPGPIPSSLSSWYMWWMPSHPSYIYHLNRGQSECSKRT